MRFVKRTPLEQIEQKRFPVFTVSQAIGKSEGSIQGYFRNRNISTKGGITIDQIEEVLESRTRGDGIDWLEVQEIRKELKARGYVQDYSDEQINEEESNQ